MGDGDLSFSLALARAFGTAVAVTGTTLLSRSELLSTYAAAAACSSELLEGGHCVLHGVDATRLNVDPQLAPLAPFDAVCFCHPHLGLADLEDEAAHARRHSCLVAHFLHAASRILAAGGHLHLTLCGNQPSTWECEAHAARLGLSIVQQLPTASPSCFSPPGVPFLAPADGRPEWRARRKFRSNALGSRHWLGKFGYEHRRSEGDADMHVENSVELVLAPGGESAPSNGCGGACAVCGYALEESVSADEHVRRMTAPLAPSEWRCEETGRRFASEYAYRTFHRDKSAGVPAAASSSSSSAAAAGAGVPPAHPSAWCSRLEPTCDTSVAAAVPEGGRRGVVPGVVRREAVPARAHVLGLAPRVSRPVAQHVAPLARE